MPWWQTGQMSGSLSIVTLVLPALREPTDICIEVSYQIATQNQLLLLSI
jgi:hypothetical protein